MMFLYNIGIRLYGFAIRMASLFNPKARRWVEGRRGIHSRLAGIFRQGDKVVWVHCASLGEFEQGRPVIERIRRDYPGYRILLTFFSPSGYLVRKNYPEADAVDYLPLDTPGNVRRFLDAVNPDIAIFVKYEFWLNYLTGLKRRKVKTYIVSAIFRPDSVFFRPWGGIFRKGLETYETIFVQNASSRDLLQSIGISNVVVSGDTRFDRVAAIPDQAPPVPLAERFTGIAREVVVAGSTWPQDEELLLELMRNRKELKLIIAPHEIELGRIERFMERSPFPAVRFTSCDGTTDLSGYGVLVVDTVGLLSSLYRYGKYAYIGGGFGAGIHNTLEAATFGLPVAFGPNYARFREARELIALGAAATVRAYGELERWYDNLESNPQLYAEAKAKSLSYVSANKGATGTIMEAIFPASSRKD